MGSQGHANMSNGDDLGQGHRKDQYYWNVGFLLFRMFIPTPPDSEYELLDLFTAVSPAPLTHSRCAINISWMHDEWNWLVFLLSLIYGETKSQPAYKTHSGFRSNMKPCIPVKAENCSCVSSILYHSLSPTLPSVAPDEQRTFSVCIESQHQPSTWCPPSHPKLFYHMVGQHSAPLCQELFSALLSLLVSGGDSSQCKKKPRWKAETWSRGRWGLSGGHFISSWISSIIKPWTSPADLMQRLAAQLYLATL